MKFKDMLNKKEVLEVINEVATTPEEILRKGNFKIKLVTGTAFGTQISMAKKYEEEEIKNILKNFNVKFKGKDIFIVD